jgi:YggT family protein
LIRIINFVASVMVLLIILNSVLSYFLDLYHPVRQFIGRIVEPLLMPIRRVVPLIGMFDISPMILILMIWVLQSAVIGVLATLR